MNRENLNFPEALEYIADLLGLRKSEFNKSVKIPFGGFYKKLIREIQEPETTMQTYDRITVPEYTFDGKLCGIMGRSIDNNCTKEERWLPIIPCSRSLTLYGYHTNYEFIQRKNLYIVGESEKFPQQLDSFGCHIGL